MHRRSIFAWAETLMWLVAASALGYVVFVIVDAEMHQSDLNRQFEADLAEQRLSKEASTSRDSAASSLTEPVQTSLPAPPTGYLGRLSIERLQMSAMILSGIDDVTLRRGIGHIPGTALPGESGNTGIAGHRDTFFRRLAEVHTRDRITIETLTGRRHYVVESMIVVEPKAVDVLDDTGRPVLTLVTCYPFQLVGPSQKRLVVRAVLQAP